MQTHPSVRPRRIRAALRVLTPLAAVGSLLLVASARLAAAGAAAPPPAPDASAALAQAAAGAAAAATPAPAVEHSWLTDKDGRRYYIEAYSKKQPGMKLDDTHLRTAWGIVIAIDHEDAANYYYRVYETIAGETGPEVKAPVISDEVKASYQVDTPSVDRLDFVPFEDGLPKAGQWRNNFTVADVNGDGKLDIVHAPPRKTADTRPVVFLGDGKGHWTRWNATFPPFAYDYGATAVADFDKDGRADIAIASHLKGIVVLVQKKPGVFSLWNKGLPFRTKSEEPLAFSSRAIVAVDWNNDGRPDIAALGEGPQMQMGAGAKPSGLMAARGVEIFLNVGDGSWREVDAGTTTTAVFGDHLAATDLNGDKRVDVVASTGAEGVKDVIFASGRGPHGMSAPIDTMRPAYAPAVAVGDFRGDKRPQIAFSFTSFEIGEWRTGIDVFDRTPDDRWHRQLIWVEEGKEAVTALATGDIDGDHKLDLVGLTGDGRVLVFLGDGKGHFALQPNALTKAAAGCRGSDVHLADLDGDGRAEIVAEFAGEPTGTPGMMEAPGCPDGGSIRAWKALPKKAAEPQRKGG